MKRIFFVVFMFIMLISMAAFARELPRIAVYVTGDVDNNITKALGTRMLATLINSGRYRGIERSNAFLAELDKEQERQRSGDIDDKQISELGKQFGVSFVCIADITPVLGEYQISARIINVETAEVILIGESMSSLKTANDLAEASDRVVNIMFQGTAQPQPQSPPPTTPPVAAQAPVPAATSSADQPIRLISEPMPESRPAPATKQEPSPVAANQQQHKTPAPPFAYSGIKNPAFINEENYIASQFFFRSNERNIYSHEFGFTVPIGQRNAVGVSWDMLYYGYDDYFDQRHLMALAYAHNVWSGLTIGGNFGISTWSWGYSDWSEGEARFNVSIGLTWKFPYHEILGNHLIGISANNILYSEIDYRYLKFSLRSDFWDRRIYYGIDYNSDMEWSDLWTLNQSLGFSIARMFKLYTFINGDYTGLARSIGFGLGANLSKFYSGRDIEGIIQYENDYYYDATRTRIAFYLRMEFGKHKAAR